MSQREIVKAWMGEKTATTPIWLMRQAGRYLPEYRALRAKAGSFLTMCYTPELAAEITLQPLRRFDLDAAIIFSDILVIPDAMGQKVSFVEGEGPKLEPMDPAQLSLGRLEDFLSPVYEALRLTRAGLPEAKALIGFAGGAFTLASYMIEGGGGHEFSKTKAMIRDDRAGFTALIDLLTQAIIRHLKAQIACGVDAVQVFESHAGQLAGADFAAFVARPMRIIAQELNQSAPLIGFARGAAQDDLLRFATDTGINAVGIDQFTDMGWAAKNIPPRLSLQGNLDPVILRTGIGLEDVARRIIDAAKGRAFVFNLGHGVIKETNPDHVARLVDAVHAAKVAA